MRSSSTVGLCPKESRSCCRDNPSSLGVKNVSLDALLSVVPAPFLTTTTANDKNITARIKNTMTGKKCVCFVACFNGSIYYGVG